MIETQPTLEKLEAFAADICIIGAGPVGLATALALLRRGKRVLVLESGGLKASADAQALSDAENGSPDTHHDPIITTARRLGGAANLWGGRCVPLDPIDFEKRPWLGMQAWPITEHDLEAHLDEAIAFLDAGGPGFRASLSEVAADPAFTFDTLERWANVHRPHHLHREEIARSTDLKIALGVTAAGFAYDEAGAISAIEAHLEGTGRVHLPAKAVVLAAGGNECARLLLAEQQRRPRLFGGDDGPLGRTYMAHLNGQIADIAIECEALRGAFEFHVDEAGGYVRRRFAPSRATQAESHLANIAFWPAVPRIHDARHCSGPLSAIFLALSVDAIGRRLIADVIRNRHLGERPIRRLPHVLNVLREPLRTLAFAPAFLWGTKLAPKRLPGLFLRNRAARYGLEYHAEHLPSPESRVSLTDGVDRIGMPRLKVDLRFSEADAASVVRAHDALDAWLRRNGLGRIEHRLGEADRIHAVLEEVRHGAHQIGTVRMGTDRSRAIVDGECVTFDVPNLAVVSTAVLPTSSQANPTLAAVQLGIRLADGIARGRVVLRPGAATSSVAA